MQQNTITFNPLLDSFVQPASGRFPRSKPFKTDDDASSSQLKGQTEPTILMSNVPTTVWSPRVFVRSRLVISGLRPVFCGFWVPQFFCAKGWTGTDQLCRFMGRYKGRNGMDKSIYSRAELLGHLHLTAACNWEHDSKTLVLTCWLLLFTRYWVKDSNF